MATLRSPEEIQEAQLWYDLDDLEHDTLDEDSESLASLETDDGQDHPPEQVLAEVISHNGLVWYLVKWKDCPVLRSSWEGEDIFTDCKWLLSQWTERKRKQEAGEEKKFDIVEHNRRICELERKERKRRLLRRLKRKVGRALEIVKAT